MKHDRSVDLTRPGLPIDLRIVQGDARTHSITYTLYEGSMRWIIPDGTTAVIHYAKGDGTGGEYDKLPDGTEAIELNNNECTIMLAEQVLTWAGCVRLQVTLSNQNGQQLSFWETIIKVLPNVAGYVVKSEDYISVTPSAIASELNDLRVDYTGKRHSKAGEAVREADKSLAGQIDKLKEDLVAYKRNIADTETTEIASIVDNGVYGLNKTTIGFSDAPSGIDNSWAFATLVVEKCFNGSHVLQTFYDSSLYDNPFYRLVTISTKTPYTSWKRTYKAEENYRQDYSASSIITKLSDFRSAGSVGIDAALSDHLTDIPSYFQHSTFTLFNITKSFNGRFVTQFIFSSNISSKTIYARIISSSDGTTYKDWVKLGEETASNKNILTNKKWVACGDSFTEGVDGEKFADGDFAGKNKVYPFFIGERNNMIIVNEAVSGSSMTYISERHNSWENGCFSVNRYKNIPNDADYITLYFGINDDNYSAPIGSIDDTKNTTFYGAWNTVLEYLITNHPFAKIGIIITNGSSKKYTDAERAISRKWGIPYLDMEADYQHVPLMQRVTERTEVCQKALELRKKAFAVSDSNTHPNAKAHEYESTFIENWLRTL